MWYESTSGATRLSAGLEFQIASRNRLRQRMESVSKFLPRGNHKNAGKQARQAFIIMNVVVAIHSYGFANNRADDVVAVAAAFQCNVGFRRVDNANESSIATESDTG